MNGRKSVWAAVAMLCGSLVSGEAVQAQDVVADGVTVTLTARDIVNGNVLAINGGTIRMTGTTVFGNVLAEKGSSLFVNGGNVEGDISATECITVSITNTAGATQVGGDITIEKSSSANLRGANVVGSVKVIEIFTPTGTINVLANTIGGDLQIEKNTARRINVRDNLINNNFQAFENRPAPVGGNNLVGGTADGQAAAISTLLP
jgi:hypothetical protein